MPIITICSHCGVKTFKEKYCPQCKTIADRKKMDDNNKKLFKDAGLKEYTCKVCKPKK